MDALLVLAILIVLALAAPRWGTDSSPHFESQEHALAARGIVWD